MVTVGRAGVLKTDPPDDPRRLAAPFRLLLRDDKGAERFEEADVVLDCTGTYGRHGWIGDGGIPAAGEIAAEKQVGYGVDDVLGRRKAQYAGKSVIVVGGGFSAATTVLCPGPARRGELRHLGDLADPRAASTPLPRNPNDPLRERDRLAARANNLATRGDGNVEYHAQVLLDEVNCHGPDKGFRVAGRCNGKPVVWEVDRVIGNVGYLADANLTRELHVREFAGGAVRQPEPGYFVLGMKSYGRTRTSCLSAGSSRYGR